MNVFSGEQVWKIPYTQEGQIPENDEYHKANYFHNQKTLFHYKQQLLIEQIKI